MVILASFRINALYLWKVFPWAGGRNSGVRKRRPTETRYIADITEYSVDGLSYERIGSGEPLLLVHGTGSSSSAWRPVRSLLGAHHELILVDLPGHGDSELPPPGVVPNPIGYAGLFADMLDTLGFERVHAAGFSVGGWTSLELAKLGRARSVTAFGPAGLWKPRSPRLSEASEWLTNRATRGFGPLLDLALRNAAARTVLLAQQYGRPWRVPAEDAIEAARTMAHTRGFDDHLKAVNNSRFTAGRAIDVPVTIAFGTSERVLMTKASRRREELPPHAHWCELPGCGHVPMWDDPELVTEVILKTTGQA